MSRSDPLPSSPPRVFISYSHDSREHCDRVLALAQQLRRDGIDAELDQFHQCELLHWPSWCAEQLGPEKSKFVLCVCTTEYKDRIEKRVPADVGKGVFWEGTLIYNYLYDAKGNERFVPVLFPGEPEDSLPVPLRGWTWFRLSSLRLEDSDPGYDGLYRLLTDRPKVRPEPLGRIKTLLKIGLSKLSPDWVLGLGLMSPPACEWRPAALEVPERQTDFAALIANLGKKIEAVGCDVAETKALAEQTKGFTQDIKSDTTEMRGLLHELLHDTVPPSSTPSRPHNLPPWMAPEYFIGRDAELRSLCEGLTTPGRAAFAVVQPQVVRGAGGIGKTRLAIQAAWVLYLQCRCDMAFRVSAASPGELDLQLAALSEKSLLALYKDREPPRELDVRREDVLHALRQSAGCWLLLLDGADSKEARDAVKKLMEQLAGGSFLITSRRDDWPKGTAAQLALDVFSPDEAGDCLVSRYWRSPPSEQELRDFAEVARKLGYLPLALVLAAGYMESRRIPPGRYLEVWKEKRDALLGYVDEALDYDRSLLAAFELSQSQLDGPAIALMNLLSWLAPEPFPRILVEDSEFVKELLSSAADNETSTDPMESLAQLKTLSLIQLDAESIQVHRLVAACARAALQDNARSDTFRQAMNWLNASMPDMDFDEAGWELWRRLAPHLDRLLEMARDLCPQERTLARVCNEYGGWLFHQSKYQAAETLMRRALVIDEGILGASHGEIARILNNLAQLLQITNRLIEAEPLMRQVLAIDEEALGPNHPNVAGDLNNLAQLLRMTNRLIEAEPLMRRALEIDEECFGPIHPSVARDLSNLGQLLQATNRLPEAEPLTRRALDINERCFGPKHPHVAKALNNLATFLYDTNRSSEAEPLMRRALAIDEEIFGSDHPNIATDLNNLALLLGARDRLTEAELLFRRALGIAEQSFGPNHPDVAKYFNNLATLLHKANRSLEAEPMMRRALEINEQSLGPAHPDVAIMLGNFAQLLQAANRPNEAEQLMRRALQIHDQAFGSGHPAVAIGLNNLAQLLQATKRPKEAEPLMRRALSIFLAIAGRTGHIHPHLAASFGNYGALLELMGIPKEQILERFAEIRREAGFNEEEFRRLLELLFRKEP